MMHKHQIRFLHSIFTYIEILYDYACVKKYLNSDNPTKFTSQFQNQILTLSHTYAYYVIYNDQKLYISAANSQATRKRMSYTYYYYIFVATHFKLVGVRTFCRQVANHNNHSFLLPEPLAKCTKSCYVPYIKSFFYMLYR